MRTVVFDLDGTLADTSGDLIAAANSCFRAMGAGRVVRVRGLDAAQAAVGHLVVEADLPKAGQPRSSSYEGEGWAIVRAEDTATVDEALATLITTVRVDVAQ